MQQDSASPGRFRSAVGEGVRRTLPVTLYVAPMGFAFGAAATQGGMSVEATLLISALMCSGSAQFAALAVYSSVGVAVIPMLLAAFTLNARHILLGAAISPWMNKVSFSRQVGAVLALSEPTWALVIRMHDVEGVRDPQRLAGVLAGGGVAIWLCWIAGTALGAILGSDFGDLSRFGLDLLVIAFFASLAARLLARSASGPAPVDCSGCCRHCGRADSASGVAYPGRRNCRRGGWPASSLAHGIRRRGDTDMSEQMLITLVILGMGLITFATRIGGVVMMRFVPLTPAIERFLRYLSSSVLIAVLAPAAFDGDLAARATLVCSALVMYFTRNALAAMAGGVAAAMLVRHLVAL